MDASELNRTRAWNRFYADGTPVDIEVPDGSLIDMLNGTVERFGDKVAVEYFGATTTYTQLHRAVQRVAGGLAELGVRAGDRVGIVLPNAPQHLIAFYAVLRLGAVVVEHNPLYTTDELRTQFLDHGATTIIAWDKVAGTVQQLAEECGIQRVIAVNITEAMPLLTRLALSLPVAKARESKAKLTQPAPGTYPFSLLASHPPLSAGVAGPRAEDIAVLQYTSGTTGVPRGAIITHGNLWSNARQGSAWMPKFQLGHEVIYGVLPSFHAFGLLLSVIYPVHLGARSVLFPTFDPALIIAASKKTVASFIPAVPPMYDRLARVAKEGKLDLSEVTYAISGAMTLNDGVVARWEAVAGGRLVEGYGLTETSPVALGNPFTEQRKTGTIGIPFPSTDIKVVDPDDTDREVALGETGELLIHGPQVFQGYWNRPDETAAVLLPGGWLRTGDLVSQDDDGFVTVVDRKKEIIITGGLNVAPTEVEKVLVDAPGIADVAVVGVQRGSQKVEIVTAVVVLEDGVEFDEEAVRAYARDHLAEYKVPRAYVVWEALPKSLIGKVLRKQVKEQLAAQK